MDMAPGDKKHPYLLGRSDSNRIGALHGLRRVRDDVPWQLWLVATIGFWERAAFWGLTAPWQNYMEHPLRHDAQRPPGALGLGQSTATRIYCAFYLLYYASPVAVAVLADGYLGRYATLLGSTALYCVGCAVLTASSLMSSLKKGLGLPGLVLAMSLISLGGGGFRATFVPFIADQQPQKRPRIRALKNDELVVTDYQLTLQYIYNLYYWVGNIGSLSWFATVYIELHVSFAAAYGLALGFMIIAFAMLVGGSRCYVKVPRTHNPLPEAASVIACACRSGFRMAHAYPVHQLQHRHKVVPWSAALVTELTRGLQACRILLAFVMFYVCFDQMQNNLISQAGQMKTSGVPNDLIAAMNQVGCIVLGPLIQEGLYPLLHRRRIYLSPVARITVGFALVALSMLYATIVQLLIYRSPPCNDQTGSCGPSQVNVWVQAPLYFFISAGEIFAYVTALEYTYDYAPKSMKVIVQAIALLVGSLGSACAMALTPAARDPYLVVFYGSLAGCMAGTTVVFWVLFHGQTEQQEKTRLDGSSQGTRQAHWVSDSAPVLQPINVGGPIRLPSRTASRSSCTFDLRRQTAGEAPALPRRSSRRSLHYGPPIDSERRRYGTTDGPEGLFSPQRESRHRSRQPTPVGWRFSTDGPP